MNPSILEAVEQLKATYQDLNLKEFHNKYKGDDEFKKIVKQKKIAKSDVNVEDRTVLITRLKKIINETKQVHKEALQSNKKFEAALQEKEKGIRVCYLVFTENNRLKTQIKVLDGFRVSSTNSFNENQEQYNKIVEEERLKKAELVEGFQQEIKEISAKMEEVSTNKHKSQAENEALKEKIKEIQGHVEKRDKLFEDELLKLDQQRKERESKIFEQIQNISTSLGTPENVDEQLTKIKEEEALVDTHLNPYLQKAEEFQQVIEKTNLQFNLYKTETEKLAQQCRNFEGKSSEFQRKCEKSDIYIVEQAKEVIQEICQHVQLQAQLKTKQEQLNSLQTLLQSLQTGQL